MTKRHATNPGVVRERRQKAAIERRAEKRERKGNTMALVHVEFDWSDECGPCDECGNPAAYIAFGRYGPKGGADLLCCLCAALAAAEDGARLTHLFAEPVTDTARIPGAAQTAASIRADRRTVPLPLA